MSTVGHELEVYARLGAGADRIDVAREFGVSGSRITQMWTRPAPEFAAAAFEARLQRNANEAAVLRKALVDMVRVWRRIRARLRELDNELEEVRIDRLLGLINELDPAALDKLKGRLR